MMNLFKSNYTKWFPLGQYSWSGNSQYIVMVRKNTKNGLLSFKSIRCNPLVSGCVNPVLPHDIIDVREAWKKITDL